MTKRRLLLATALLSVGAAAVLAACADDGPDADATSDASSPLPTIDGGNETGGFDAASPADPCLPQTLCPIAGIFAPSGSLDVRTRLSLVRGRAPDDVWAMGAHGAAFHFDGTSWARSDLGSVQGVAALWLRDSSEVAFSAFSSIFARNVAIADAGAGPSDGGWLHVDRPTLGPSVDISLGHLTGAWTTPSATWVWITTEEIVAGAGFDTSANGLYRGRYVPASKTFDIESPFPDNTCTVLDCRQLVGLHGSSADDLWAVGFTGAAVHIENAQSATPTVQPFDSKTWAGLNGVWVAAATDAWMVGGQGTIRHYAGAPHYLEVVEDIPTSENLNAVWGSSASDIWAVGENAAVIHYDGKAWSKVRVTGLAGRKPTLYSVWTGAPGHVWMVGDGILLSMGGKP